MERSSVDKYVKNQKQFTRQALNEWKTHPEREKFHIARLNKVALYISKKVDKKASLLDVGCRNGQLLDALRNLGFENISGIEISSKAAEEVRRRGHNVIVGDVHNIDCFKSRYDLIIAVHILEHCHDPMKALRNMASASKNGAYLVIELPIQAKQTVPTKFMHYHIFYTADYLHEMVYKAGFDFVEEKPDSWGYGALFKRYQSSTVSVGSPLSIITPNEECSPKGKMKKDNWWNKTKNLGNFFYWGWTFCDWTNPARLYAAHWIDDGDTILEIGPGSGIDYQVMLIQKPNSKYLALDVSNGFIEAFKKRFPEVAGRVVLGNLDTTRHGFLPLADNCVDVVLARHVIDHCEHYTKPIEELIRVAKKKVIFALWVGLGPAGSGDRIKYNEDNCWTNTYDRGPFIEFLSSFGYWVHGRRLSNVKWEQVFVIDKLRKGEVDIEVDEFFPFQNEPKEELDRKYRRFVSERQKLARLRSE